MNSRFPRAAWISLLGLTLAGPVSAQTAPASTPASPPASPPTSPPDESLLGTVEVDGSAGGLPPLPKLGMISLTPAGDSDQLTQTVVRRDLDLSGQYDVLAAEAPDPLAPRDGPVDLAPWRAKGAEVVVRVRAEARGASTDIVAEAYLTAKAGAPSSGPEAGKPVYQTTVSAGQEVRAASHRVVDELVGALTGRPASFASHMTFARRSGTWQTAAIVDADGYNPRLASPSDVTVLSPAFGPGGILYYLVSRDYAPFRVVVGPAATPLPIRIPGSVLGLAISPEGTRAALTVMSDGKSSIFTADGGKLTELTASPLAHHPAFGPLGKVAYVGGTPVQRVHVDGAAVSPPGFMASAPTFCDTAQGLWIIFTVEVAGGAELVSTDTSGGSMRRLTQRQGENRYPACSPDGRLIAFFSTTKSGAGPGLYVMPVGRPWLAKKVSSELGQSLRWERLPAVKR